MCYHYLDTYYEQNIAFICISYISVQIILLLSCDCLYIKQSHFRFWVLLFVSSNVEIESLLYAM